MVVESRVTVRFTVYVTYDFMLEKDWGKLELKGGGVAQLVKRRSGKLLTQVRFPGAQGIFLPESTFSADSLTVSVHPHVQSQALTTVRTLKIL